MKKIIALILASILINLTVNSQTTALKNFSGVVKDESTGEFVQNATVRFKNSGIGTTTDVSGTFYLKSADLPFTIIISHSSFESKAVTIESEELTPILITPKLVQLEGVVLGPKGIPTKIINAPYTVYLIGHKQAKQLPTTSIYDDIASINGMTQIASSLTFKTPSSRGFNGSGSSRVNQIVSGMDGQAPGLNFFVGNFAGLSDIDIESIELMPGASSALYGPGGMNGTIVMNAKDPFNFPGLSVDVKQGIMHIDKKHRTAAAAYNDYAIRWAKSFKNKFAFKLGFQYLSANDWLANDSTNYQRNGTSGKLISGNRQSDPNYDGVNLYGDETTVNMYGVAQQMVAGNYLPPSVLPLIPNQNVSRTGYDEKDVIDPITKNIKIAGALHYKINSKLEAILMGNWATGNTVYTDDNRYVLKGIKIGQYKLELKHKNWFFRTYTTQENAGDAYSATVTTQYFNEAWKPSGLWYPQYVGAYAQGAGQIFQNIIINGGTPEDALAAVANAGSQLHEVSRQYADQGRPVAGSNQFNHLFDSVRSVPIPNGGRFKEKSQLWMTEGQYSFRDAAKNVEVIVGGNYKRYILNSSGTLFIDTINAISINETGLYTQLTRKFFDSKLTLIGSGRFDKNENFKGQFTPRIAALIRIAENNNLRVSYQTAYRFPGNLTQWIRLNVGGDFILLGGLPWVMDYMHADKDPVYQIENGMPSSTAYAYKNLEPETMRSFEVGYKGWIKKKLLIDAYAYFGKYENFLGRIGLIQNTTGNAYSIVVNSDNKVSTHGFGLSLDYRMKKNYSLFCNVSSDIITNVPTGFKSYFNSPKYRFNAGFANSGLGKNKRTSFNIMMRWQDAFEWEGELANGPLPAFTTADAQVSYSFPKIKSSFRIGGTNILNKYYKTAYANPSIGAVYYVGFNYNL